MKHYKLTELAREVGSSAKTLRRRVAEGYLTGQRLGNTVLYTWEDWRQVLRRSQMGVIKLKQDGKRGNYTAEKVGKQTVDLILTKLSIREMCK